MKVIRLYLLVGLLFQIVNADYIYPLKKGASWSYEIANKNKSIVTNKITAIKKVDNKIWYKLIEFNQIIWIRNSKLGQVEAADFYGEENPKLKNAKEIIAFRFPTKVGEKWKYFESIVTYKGVEALRVPAGSFDCHMYFIDGPDEISTHYCISKDVGLVYKEELINGKSDSVARLTKYQ